MNIFSLKRGAALLAALTLVACGAAQSPAELQLENGWVRAMPPGMKMTAAFGELTNPGDAEIVLVSWSSPDFGDVSLHRTEQVDGVSRMREVDRLAVPAGGSVALEPGGLHLMLMMPGERPSQDAPVTVAGRAEDGREYRFELPVERR